MLFSSFARLPNADGLAFAQQPVAVAASTLVHELARAELTESCLEPDSVRSSSSLPECAPTAIPLPFSQPNNRGIWKRNTEFTKYSIQVLPFQFSSFERLEMLDFTNNQLESLGNDSFSGLPSLRQLYLGENQIGHIQTNAFSQNSSIVTFPLIKFILNQILRPSSSWNRIEWLSWQRTLSKTFVNCSNFHSRQTKCALFIKQIHAFPHFQLRTVDAGAFQGNPALVMLDLSHNELIDLAPATFLTQLNLLLVDLSHNHIIRTPFGAFGRRVATVLLQGNLSIVSKFSIFRKSAGLRGTHPYAPTGQWRFHSQQ